MSVDIEHVESGDRVRCKDSSVDMFHDLFLEDNKVYVVDCIAPNDRLELVEVPGCYDPSCFRMATN